MKTAWTLRFPMIVTLFSLLPLAKAAPASDALVRILWSPQGDQNVSTGSFIPRDRIDMVLFIKEDCPLKVENASQMGRAWIRTRSGPVCWIALSDGSYIIVDQYGDRHWSKVEQFLVVSFTALPHAMLHRDGSATITEPNFNGSAFWANVLARRTR